MKKANIFRSIFWGLVMLIFLSGGIIGAVYNNKTFGLKKAELEKIVDIFNNNKRIEDYKKIDTDITASLKGRKIVVTYESVNTKEYVFNFKKDCLVVDLEQSDSIGRFILMIVADSISVVNGGFEEDVYPVFSTDSILSYKLKDGIEFLSVADRYKVKLSLDYPIKKLTNTNTDKNNS